MAFNTYTDLKASIENWLVRDDLSAYHDDFIALAEERLARDVRIWGIEAALNDSISSGVVSVPSDFQELKLAYIDADPVRPLDVRPAWWIYREYPIRTAEGEPAYIAVDGANFIFAPYPDSGYTVKGTYWKKPTALSSTNETNEWTTYCPDLLLWATLSEASPFIGDDQRVAVWESKYETTLRKLNRQDQRKTRRNARVMHG